MTEKFDVIVVGAGASGNTAAYIAAKAGLNVLQLERGEYPGAKNVQGAILYASAVEEIIPEFRDEAPLERHIIEQRIWMLDKNAHIGTHFRSENFNEENPNRYTIIRADFDKWFSGKVREAGALVICETTVVDLLRDGNRVVGVRCDRRNGDVLADVVILAEGANALVSNRAGLAKILPSEQAALAVKEMHFLPPEVIQERFNLSN
jgi:electron transfer flavoprotein-quinone oxidoreductase